jgi:CheY-like chemotaxis protein
VSVKSILVVEDSQKKWDEINALFKNMSGQNFSVHRATTILDANRLISDVNWDLVLLDISMDIRESSSAPSAGGHDTTGGLRIAERMFYLDRDAPIIIVTAFDAFPASIEGQGALLGLDDVVRRASRVLGDLLIGVVRYREDGWAEHLTDLVNKVFKK